MWWFNSIFSKVFEILFLPFRSLSPWAGMILISLLTSFLMLFIFRRTSNQEGIKTTKNKIKAHLLELRLFSDNMSASFRAQRRILAANLKYIGYNSKPMLVMIIPILLILIQLNMWFGADSLKPGQSVIVKVRLTKGQTPIDLTASLEPSPLIEVETPPLRIEDESEIDWRIRAREKGRGSLALTIGGERVAKEVAVAQPPLSKISVLKVNRNLVDQIFNPGEAPLPARSVIRSIDIQYPAQSLSVFGGHIHWLIAYFFLSIIFGFTFKGIFHVEI